MTSQEVALQVIQQAICALADWADSSFRNWFPHQLSIEYLAVTKAKELLSWHDEPTISYLELLFDAVKLSEDNKKKEQHYCPAVAIDATDNSYPSIPYPLTKPPDLEEYKENVKKELKNLREQDWHNL